MMNNTCAIIAGAGAFPRHVAQEAKRQGLTVTAIGLEGWVDPLLARHVDAYEELAIGQLGQLIHRLKDLRVNHAVMAGQVTKEVLFDSGLQFDAEALALLTRVKEFSVNALLGAIADRLAAEGITLLDSSTFLKDQLCPLGVLTQHQPSAQDQDDIRLGVRAARALAALDIGQTVVIKRRVVVAVEALEGTDAALLRAGQLAKSDLVVVKMASPHQDMRFDLPVLGLHTISTAATSGVRCVAIEARKTVLLDKNALIHQANIASICLVGIDPQAIEAD